MELSFNVVGKNKFDSLVIINVLFDDLLFSPSVEIIDIFTIVEEFDDITFVVAHENYKCVAAS